MSRSLIERLFSSGQSVAGRAFRLLAGQDPDDQARPLITTKAGELLTDLKLQRLGPYGAQIAQARNRVWSIRSGTRSTNPFLQSAQASSGAGSGITGGASGSWVVTVNGTGVNGDFARFQSRHYIPLGAGQPCIAYLNAQLEAADTGGFGRLRVGLFDDEYGFFWQVSDPTSASTTASFQVVFRSSTDTAVSQSAFNIDRLDGTGPSGKTIRAVDVNNRMVTYVVGVGAAYASDRVLLGIIYEGELIWVHQFTAVGLVATAVTQNLPCRWEVTLDGGNATTFTQLRTVGGSAFVHDLPNLGVDVGRVGVTRALTTALAVPILALRLGDLNATTAQRLRKNLFRLQRLSLRIDSDPNNPVDLKLRIEKAAPGRVSGGAWANVDGSETVEANHSGSSLAVVPFMTILAFDIPTNSGWGERAAATFRNFPTFFSREISPNHALAGQNGDATASALADEIVVVAQLSSAVNTTVSPTLEWREYVG